MEMSKKDKLIIWAMWAIAMIIYLLIFYDPLEILDTSQKWIIFIIVTIVNSLLLIYHVKRIQKR